MFQPVMLIFWGVDAMTAISFTAHLFAPALGKKAMQAVVCGTHAKESHLGGSLKRQSVQFLLELPKRQLYTQKDPNNPWKNWRFFPALKKLVIVMRPRNEGNVDSHGSYYDDATVSP